MSPMRDGEASRGRVLPGKAPALEEILRTDGIISNVRFR